MSVLKKKAGVILLIIAVIGFGYWLFHEDEVVPDFSSNNKIELIANVLRNRNADKIRDKEWNIINPDYEVFEKDNMRKKVKLTDSQKKEVLQKVQKELNQFLDKMKQQLVR